MKKTNLILCALIFPWLHAFGQEVVTASESFLTSNRSDSIGLHFYAKFAYTQPDAETNDYQKSRIGDKKGYGQISGGKMEMFYTPIETRDGSLKFHAFATAQFNQWTYMCTRQGIGITIRLLGKDTSLISLGLFDGQYYRQVASGGNFFAPRGKQYDNYMLYGGYVFMADRNMSLFLAPAFEKRDMIVSTRAALRLGHIIPEIPVKSFEVLFSSDYFYRSGAGVSFEVVPKLRVEVLRTFSDEHDMNEQARIDRKLAKRNWSFSISYCVN